MKWHLWRSNLYVKHLHFCLQHDYKQCDAVCAGQTVGCETSTLLFHKQCDAVCAGQTVGCETSTLLFHKQCEAVCAGQTVGCGPITSFLLSKNYTA